MNKMTTSSEYQIDIKRNKAFAVSLFSKVIGNFDALGMDYWIEYGTMLGAVREKGFIPWDSEFDVGVWNEHYQTNRAQLERTFIELGFHLNFEAKDRIKLVHQDLTIGAYTIDIHTYHLKNDVAYVSFNRRKLKLIENMYNAFKLYDNNTLVVYPIAGMVKKFLSHGMDIPNHFTFRPGPVRSPKSYILQVGDSTIDNQNEYCQGMSLFRKFAVNSAGIIFSILPNIVQARVVKFVKEKSLTIDRDYGDVQAIPAHFYQNLELIAFETIMVKAPKDAVEYVKSVYGPEWHVRKSNWINSQNQINKSLQSL